MPQSVVAAWQARPKGEIEVWAENWEAMTVWLAMGTQWRVAGLTGLPIGLDYAALPVVTGALGLRLDEGLLARLRVMEDTAVQELVKR